MPQSRIGKSGQATLGGRLLFLLAGLAFYTAHLAVTATFLSGGTNKLRSRMQVVPRIVYLPFTAAIALCLLVHQSAGIIKLRECANQSLPREGLFAPQLAQNVQILAGQDPATGRLIPLCTLRKDRWKDHFVRNDAELRGRTLGFCAVYSCFPPLPSTPPSFRIRATVLS